MIGNSHKLSYTTSNIYKVFAIFMVVVSHWYRYYDVTSIFALLKSIGFFGAALFAFLSGYGVCISYKSKGIGRGWLREKLIKVYVPFVLVNTIAGLTIYKNKGIDLLFQVVTGKEDFVMWYVPFILCFYFIFWLAVKNEKYYMKILIAVGLMWIIYGLFLRIGSQWYTATGALLTGTYVGKSDKKNNNPRNIKKFLISFIFLLFSSIMSQKAPISFIKDMFTIISGIFFVLMSFYAGISWQKGRNSIDKIIIFLGGASFWVYLVHMKILYLLISNENYSMAVFLISSFIISCISYYLYNKFINRINTIKREQR